MSNYREPTTTMMIMLTINLIALSIFQARFSFKMDKIISYSKMSLWEIALPR